LRAAPSFPNAKRLLAQLDDADQAVERIVTEAAGTSQAELWRQLSTAVRGFSSEARRLLVRKNVPTYTSRDLLRHHEEVTAIVAKMIANNASRTLAAQNADRSALGATCEGIARTAERMSSAGSGLRDLHRAHYYPALP
jgi:ABC-type transporter Mla subunit MlaD